MAEIVFEPGIHANTTTEVNNVWQAFYQGDLNSHYWNPEVSRRLQTYNPRILTIDGQSANQNGLLAGHPSANIPDQDRNFIWLTMPAWPSVVNSRQKDVYVVLGDFDSGKTTDLLTKVTGTESPESKDALNSWGKNIETNGMQEADSSEALFSDIFGLGKDALTYYATYKGITSLWSLWDRIIAAGQLHQMNSFNMKVSRKEFLGATAAAGFTGATGVTGLATTLVRKIALGSAPTQTDESSKERFQALAGLVRPRFRPAKWLDARTAMEIAKTYDALSLLKEDASIDKNDIGATLMGNGHEYRATEFVLYPNTREEAISSFAEEIIGSLEDLTRGFLNFPLVKAKNMLLDYLTYTEVVRVVSPTRARVSNPTDITRDLIQMQFSFKSAEVEEAVKHLR